ncbi:MAG: ZIP family metal transporter [Candidatus Gracilibacteria bacterium]|jgi:zinc and cadmium transporter
MPTLSYIIIASLTMSVISFIGIIPFLLKKKSIENFLILFVSLSAGALLSSAFLHLLPEAAQEMPIETMFTIVISAFIVFFLVEKVLHWQHCHKTDCKIHSYGHMNLFGDFVHNFIDGLIIAATFIADTKLGIVATAAVALHEIPQEIGDFGVLLHAGFKKKSAVIYNFLIALSAVLGGIIGYFAAPYFGDKFSYLIPFAAGGFIYIAASDLVPEMRKEMGLKKSILAFVMFLAGIILMMVGEFLGLAE